MKFNPSLLITGAGGMLGNTFVRSSKQLSKVYSPIFFAYHALPKNFNSDQNLHQASFDALDKKSLTALLSRINPDVVINCTAMTIVENCEKNPDLTYKLNAQFPEILAKWTAKYDKKLVHYSTDSVFDGKNGNYTEADKPNPLNIYAKSKLKGERLVLKTDPNALILRTNIIGIRGHKPYPLAEWMLRRLAADKKITGFTDVIFAPLFTQDLVDLTILAIEKKLTGLYHLNAKNPLSKYRFAKLLAAEFGYNPNLIISAKSDQVLSTPRPRKTYLNSSAFVNKTKISLPTVSQSIALLHQSVRNGKFRL